MFDTTGRSGEELAARVVANETELRQRECEVLVLAAGWADLHDIDTSAPGYQPLVERGVGYGGDGCPEISEYAVHELGALRGTSSGTAEQLIADALDLRHRHPRLWDRVRAGQVRSWQAVHVARSCHHLSRAAAGLVDVAVSGHLGQLPWARFGRILQAAIIQADPTTAAERAEEARRSRGVWSYPGEDGLKTLVAKAAAGDVTCLMATVNRLADILECEGDRDDADQRRAKALGLLAQPARALQLLIAHQHPAERSASAPPEDDEPESEPDHQSLDLTAPAGLVRAAGLGPQVVLHVHLSDTAVAVGHGVVRPEHGEPTSLDQLRSWLAETGCSVTVRPVLDPADVAAVDAYETPTRMREALFTRHPVEVFPFGAGTRGLDCDHSTPYGSPSRGGPPGQTGLHNLGPLARSSHRAVTFGRWRRRQPEAGTYVFRTPHGYVFVVTNQGSINVGRGDFAADVWRRARQQAPGQRSDQRSRTASRALASVASADSAPLAPRATRIVEPSCCSTVSVTPAFATRTPASGVAARK